MKLIVGLGNPGPEYAQTRHNAGFMVVDRLIQRCALETGRSQFHALAAEGFIAGEKCLVLKPTTFMNRSGLSAGEALAFYKLDPASDLLVISDDIALPVGSLRLRPDGGAGGHNGLKDIQRAVGGPNYARLRIGIDPPAPQRQVDYVLGRFTDEQFDRLTPALMTACDVIGCWVKDGPEAAMNKYNGSPA